MAKIDRANILKNKLSKTSFYKLDCYFDKYDTNKITSLIYVYVIAGVSAIDLKLDKDIVIRARETISKAINYSNQFENSIINSPFLFVSCYSSDIVNLDINQFSKILRLCQNEGAEFFELHNDLPDISLVKDKLLIVKEVFSLKPISINLSRDKLSNANIVEQIKFFRTNIQKDIIIEVNGSEEGNNNKYNATLQSISTADIIQKQLLKKEIAFRKIPILLSGGTNSLTFELAKECNVHFNGITFSDFARNDFEEFLQSHSVDNDFEIKDYIKKIKNLLL